MAIRALLSDPENLCALGTALLGVLVFALASRLPTFASPAFTRLIGFFMLMAAGMTLWLLTEWWQPAALMSGLGLAVMVLVHFVQTRRAGAPPPAATPKEIPAEAPPATPDVSEEME